MSSYAFLEQYQGVIRTELRELHIQKLGVKLYQAFNIFFIKGNDPNSLLRHIVKPFTNI